VGALFQPIAGAAAIWHWLYGRTHEYVAGSQHVLNFVVGLAGRGFTLPVFHHKVHVLRSTKGGTRTLTY